MEIRAMQMTDLESITELFITVCATEPWHDEWTFRQAKQYLTDFYQTPNFIGLVALEADQIVGYLFGVCRIWWSGNECYINELGVEPSKQRRGIGKLLFEQLTEKLVEKNIHTLTLLTDHGVPAETFYKRQGFKEIERLMFMYKEF